MELETKIAQVCAYDANRYDEPCYSPFTYILEDRCPDAPVCPDGWTSSICLTDAAADDPLGCYRCAWTCKDPVVTCYHGLDWPQSACDLVESCRLNMCQSLDLSSKGLNELPQRFLEDIEHITHFSLRNNSLSSLPHDIMTLTLLNVDISENPFESISLQTFCDSVYLETLSLTNTRLSEYIANATFACPGASNEEVLFGRLKTLHLAKNNLADLPVSMFSHMRMLSTLNLQDNMFTRIPAPIVETKRYAGGQVCADVPANPDGSPSWWSEGGCSIVAPILLDGISCTTNLSQSVVNESYITGTTNGVEGTLCNYCCETCAHLNDPCPLLLQSLEILNLEHNEIVDLGSGSFSGLGSLIELHLDANRISSLDAQTSEGTFYGLDSLRVLSISDCELGPFIDSFVFEELSSLESLNLAGNSIAFFGTDV
eukprot:g908.t1